MLFIVWFVFQELDRTFEQLNIALGKKQKSINSFLSADSDVLSSRYSANDQVYQHRHQITIKLTIFN